VESLPAKATVRVGVTSVVGRVTQNKNGGRKNGL